MKPLKTVLGLAAACTACCAIPLAVPFVLAAAGSAFGAFGLAAPALVAAAFATVAALLIFRARRRGCEATACTIRGRSKS